MLILFHNFLESPSAKNPLINRKPAFYGWLSEKNRLKSLELARYYEDKYSTCTIFLLFLQYAQEMFSSKTQ